jgi:hypothetical protein
MKRKVTSIQIHEMKVVIPGLGQVPSTIPSDSKTLPNLEMWYDGSMVEVTTGSGNGLIRFGIPLANLQFIRFEAADPVTTTKK